MADMVMAATFVAMGESSPFTATRNRAINITLSGTFVATVRLERSFDTGATWVPLTIDGTAWATYTAPVSEAAWEEAEFPVMYRLACTAYTSGTVTYRVSQ